ncbi:MAG: arsenate reductase ArsC [Burkholderiales bacterium]|nr:arsenate reductase ArsC [Burkholderiales bacterium]
MSNTYNVLFLCTGNSARSVMAEALVTVIGGGRFVGYSAGSHPTGRVNPFAVELTTQIGYPAERLRSKSWDEFAAASAPQMDFIITVCDNAAGEVCPYWPGQPTTAHWGFADPAAVNGTDEEKRHAFRRIFNEITQRVRAFASLPLEALDAQSMQSAVRQIGESSTAAV